MTNVSRIVSLGAPCIVFYDVWRLLGAPDSNDLIEGVGPLKKPFARLRRFGESGSDECLKDPGSGKLNVSYSTVSGGSRSSRFERGWVRLEPCSRVCGGSENLEVTNVSGIVALGGSKCRIL